MRKAILYKITNRVTSLMYIGVTTMTIGNRWSVHLYKLRNGKATAKLQQAYDTYGEENFNINIIAEGYSDEMYALEKVYTKETVINGYNTIVGGNDFDERRSASLIGHEKMRNNIAHREMVSKKISDKNKGKVISKESRVKMSDAKKGKLWTDEKKEKRRELWKVRGHSCIGRYRWYLNLQTGIFYDTKDMYDMFDTNKSGLKTKFKNKSVEVNNFIKA